MKRLTHVTEGYMNYGCLGEKLTKKCLKSELKRYGKGYSSVYGVSST